MDVPSIVALATAGTALVGVLVNSYVSLRNSRTLRTLKDEIHMSAIEEVTKRRLEVYQQLWDMTGVAPPSRPATISMEERRKLEQQLTDWYYRNGSGMLLSGEARSQFVFAKKRLLDGTLDASEVVDDLSALRSKLKMDIRGLSDDVEGYAE